MTEKLEKDFVVLKGSQWAGPLFDGYTKRVSEAGLFSRAEAEAFVAGKVADGYSIQPLAFYETFFLEERKRIDYMLKVLGVTP
jgi:hypothetical protein